jgi:hypothetical protein
LLVSQAKGSWKEAYRVAIHRRFVLPHPVSETTAELNLRLIVYSCYICQVVSTVLQECRTTGYQSYYDFHIAILIFSFIGNYLLLVVVVYNLNSMLRRQVDHSNAIFKIVPLAIVGVMGILMCVLAGLGAYLNWSNKERLFYGYRAEDDLKIAEAYPKLQAAYYSLYLVSVLASGGLALMTILSLRRASKPGGVSLACLHDLRHR